MRDADLAAVFAALPGATAVFAPDPRFTVLAASDAFVAAARRSREAVVGGPAEALPNARPDLQASLAACVRTGTPQRMLRQRHDLQRPDGAWEARFWDAVNIPVPGPDGAVRYVLHQSADVTAQVLGDAATARAEGRAELLSERMSDAHCVLDRELRIVGVNAAAERVLGRPREALLGRSHREVFPGTVDRAVQRVVAEGVEQHFTHHATEGCDLHVEADAYPTDEGGVDMLWRDVTERVRAEAALRLAAAHDAYRVALTDALRGAADPVEAQAVATRVLGDHLGASRVMYGEADPGSDDAFTNHREYRRDPAMPTALGGHRWDDFGAYVATEMRAGRTLVVDEVRVHPGHSAEDLAAYEAVGIRAYLAVPLVREGRIVAYLAVNHTTPHAWTADEIALTEETAERTWAAVEQARAEAALRDSETLYRHLFETVGDAICLLEIVEDDAGIAVDYRYVDVNTTFGRHTGLTDVVGRRGREVTPGDEAYWIDHYGAIARTGETRRFENYHQATGRWYEVHASRILRGQAPLVSVFFRDVTDRKRAEEAMRGSESRLRAVLEQAPLAIAFTGPSGEILFRNAMFDALWGPATTLEEWPGARAVLTGEVVEGEVHEIVRAGGVRITGWFAGGPIRDEAGAIAGGVVLFRDVTEERRTQDALRQSEEKYRALFSEMDEAYAVVELLADETGRWRDFRFLEVNPAFMRHTGMPYPVTQTAIELLETPNPRWVELYARAATTGESIRVEEREATLGRVFDLNIFRLGGEGSRRVAVLFTNITERKRAEEELRRSEERQRYLIRLGDALRPHADPAQIQGEAIRVLGEHLRSDRAYYVEVDELRGEYVVERDWHRGGVSSHARRYPLAAWRMPWLDDGKPWVVRDVDTDVAMPDDQRASYRGNDIRACVVVPLIKNGRLVATLVANEATPRDWTEDEVVLLVETAERTWAAVERARAEEALRENDRRKDEFLAMLAHELRNPLAPIRTGLEVIRLAGGSGASVDRVRATMERQVGHLVRLVDDLLDVSRITSGKLHLQRKTTALASVVNGAIEANRAAIEAAGIGLQVRIPDEPCLLDVDPTRIMQVLSNLLHNALKYTAPGGSIAVVARCTTPQSNASAGELELTVSDDGAGISPQLLPRIFDLFTQGREAGSGAPGLGIGLALARRLVEMHGGRIEAASEGPGRGATFTFHLPIPRHVGEDDVPGATAPKDSVVRRVVVIDDNEDVAAMMAMLVEALGSQARVAHDGNTGLRTVAEFEPEIVLLDIGMPGMDGYETCRRLRAGPFGQDLLIVALTGWGQDQDKRNALEAGFDAHLTKPADPLVLERLLSAPRGTKWP